MTDPWFLIIGTGRCGTGYMHKLMQSNGLDCGHEDFFNPLGNQQDGLDGDASWLALPHIEKGNWKGKVIHITRNPIHVVRSLSGIEFFHSNSSKCPYTIYARSHEPRINGISPLNSAVDFWVHWNRRCARVADITMQVENIDYKLLSQVLDQRIKPTYVYDKYNHRNRDQTLTRDEILKLLNGRQKPFGY